MLDDQKRCWQYSWMGSVFLKKQAASESLTRPRWVAWKAHLDVCITTSSLPGHGISQR